jgi:hypothetical protein
VIAHHDKCVKLVLTLISIVEESIDQKCGHHL